ncbi:MAG TPA: DUF6600 domain-containing protein [Bryobacteraceae bacterium]|nr:DUF6600 domain-containing protein [Bryobacteraceae bacterium]
MRHFSTGSVRSAFLIGSAMALAMGAGPAFAQDNDDAQRGVARISVMDGQVSVKRGDAGEWVAGIINAPLMSDDSVATGANSRTEVQFDSSNILRIGGNAEVHLTTLEAQRFQMELAKGTVTYDVIRASSANVELDTPSVSIRPSRIGIYRISVNDAGETQLTVRSGDVEVFSPKGSQWVNAGQTMMARGAADNPEFQMVPAIAVDDWDHWNESRDQQMMQSAQAYDNVPPGVYGVEDMQGQGNWVNTPDYGNVWQPTTVAPGWAPYSSGQWVWQDWYGWSWVDSASWGWAPFHYGRWFWRANYGWLWYPGVHGVRHYWSPGLVAFFGWGHGAGFGFGFGNIGWVPLAPYEVFHPWWGRGFYGAGFAGRSLVTNVNVYSTFRNARALNGVSGVTGEGFRGGHFGGITHLGQEQVRTAGLVRGQMPIGPSAANLHYSGAATTPYRPGAAGASHFFQHQAPASVQHMAVTQSLRNENSVGRSAAGGAQGERFGGQAARPEQNGASGGRTFGSGGSNAGAQWGSRQSAAMQNTRPAQGASQAPAQNPGSNSGTWSRFGAPGSGGRSPAAGRTERPEGSYGQPRTGNEGPMRISPPVVQQRSQQPSYNAPQRQAQAPSYSAPRQSAPSYSAPRQSAPSYSAPRSSGGGGGGGARPSGGGGGGGRSSGGGGRR